MSGKNLTSVSTKPGTVHVPLSTEPVRAADIEVQAQALYNYCHSLYDGKIVVAAGVTMSIDSAGALTCNGTATFNGTGAKRTVIAQEDVEASDIDTLTTRIVIVNESIDLGSTAEFTAPTNSNVAVLGRSQGRPRIYMADVATVTIDTSQADEFVLDGDPTAASPNVIVLRSSTAPLPREDETITLVIPSFDTSTGGPKYAITREDATVICTFDNIGTHIVTTVSAQFRFSSGVWRLGPNSGSSFWWNNAGTANVIMGVVPGASA